MVHKKSEYRLQFHLLAKDLRKQIWQDNIKFRERRRSVNQAHHYWDYQLTDDECICENHDDENEVDDALLPPHKLKHKVLLAKYGRRTTKDNVNVIPPLPSSLEDVPQRQVQLKSPEIEQTSAREIAVQTPDWTIDENRTTDTSSHELQNMMQNLNTSSASDLHAQSQQTQECLQPSSTERPHSSVNQCLRSTSACYHKEDPRGIAKASASHSSEPTRYPSPSRFSSLSRTSRKSYFQDKKSPFVSYGWNDTEKDVGLKKTYNVHAPETEVYSPALRALKNRKEDIKKYLAKEADKTGSSLSARSAINHSSLWMTEYQEKFAQALGKQVCTERTMRPASTSILKKPVDWRYS